MKEKRNPLAEQSRKWLTEALLTLMKEKDYSEITVTGIAERALLSRRTFYRAFSAKEDVLKEYFHNMCKEYVGSFERGRDYSIGEIAEIFFGFWEERIDFLILLQKNHLFYYLLEEFNKVLPSLHNYVRSDQEEYGSPMELKIALLASAGALWNILAEWINMENRPGPKEMSFILIKGIERNT